MEIKYTNYEDNIFELGGFAEYPEDIDGDFEAFNSCLANEYIACMIAEDFEALGELNYSLIVIIYMWGKDYLGDISREEFYNGSFLTNKNRTFIEAITEKHAYKAGEAYSHVNNPKFLAMMIAYSEFYRHTLSYGYRDNMNCEEYHKLVQDTIKELNIIYESIDEDKQIELLKRVNNTLKTIRVPNNFTPCKIPRNNLGKQLIKLK